MACFIKIILFIINYNISMNSLHFYVKKNLIKNNVYYRKLINNIINNTIKKAINNIITNTIPNIFILF